MLSPFPTFRTYWKGLVLGCVLIFIEILFYGVTFRNGLFVPSSLLFGWKSIAESSGAVGLGQLQILLLVFRDFLPYLLVLPHASLYLLLQPLLFSTSGEDGIGLIFIVPLLFSIILPLYPIGGLLIQALFRRSGSVAFVVRNLVIISYIVFLAFGAWQVKSYTYDFLKGYNIGDEGVEVIDIQGLYSKLEVNHRPTRGVSYDITYFRTDHGTRSQQDGGSMESVAVQLYVLKFPSKAEMYSYAAATINELVFGYDGNTVIGQRMNWIYKENIYVGGQNERIVCPEALWAHSSTLGYFILHVFCTDREASQQVISDYNKAYPPEVVPGVTVRGGYIEDLDRLKSY